MELLNEEISHDDLKKYLKEFYNYACKRLNIDVPPRLFLKNDKSNADDFLGKTGGYDPENQEIYLYITNRHPKDIVRSFSHELVHHAQKLKGFNKDLNIGLIQQDAAYAQHDEGLREMERDAFERGNMIFRDWTDSKKLERKDIMKEAKFKDKVKAIKKSLVKKGKSSKSAETSAKKIAGAMVRDEKSSNQKEAQEQAKQDMKSRLGKEEVSEQSDFETVEKLQEQQDKDKEEVKHPYPQLFQEKQRLMKDAFNKKEELVYQELIRRFLKK